MFYFLFYIIGIKSFLAQGILSLMYFISYEGRFYEYLHFVIRNDQKHCITNVLNILILISFLFTTFIVNCYVLFLRYVNVSDFTITRNNKTNILLNTY